MPAINMSGLDTQTAPMGAVEDVVKDYVGGFLTATEAIDIVTAIVHEWRA